jgi:hypothetical protein
MNYDIGPETTVWTTGQNEPGYLPNPDDVRVFATQEAARLDVADRISELAVTMTNEEEETSHVDYLTDESYLADTDRPSFGAIAQAENIRHNADQDYNGNITVQVDNMTHTPPVFWAQPSTLADAFGDDTTSEEYLNVVHDLRVEAALEDFRTAPFVPGKTDTPNLIAARLPQPVLHQPAHIQGIVQ